MDLITFLRARLDEDEEVARATRKNEQFVRGTDRWFASHSNAITSMAPHRAIAEVEAKRQIIEHNARLHQMADPATHPDQEYVLAAGASDYVLRLLTLPYADHIDYREEWRP